MKHNYLGLILFIVTTSSTGVDAQGDYTSYDRVSEQTNNEKTELFFHALNNIGLTLAEDVRVVTDIICFLHELSQQNSGFIDELNNSLNGNYVFNGNVSILSLDELLKLNKDVHKFIKIGECYTKTHDKDDIDCYVNNKAVCVKRDKKCYTTLKYIVSKYIENDANDAVEYADLQNDVYRSDIIISALKSNWKKLIPRGKTIKDIYCTVFGYTNFIPFERVAYLLNKYLIEDPNTKLVNTKPYIKFIKNIREYNDDEYFQTYMDIIDDRIQGDYKRIYYVLYCLLNKGIALGGYNDIRIIVNKAFEKKGFKCKYDYVEEIHNNFLNRIYDNETKSNDESDISSDDDNIDTTVTNTLPTLNN